MSPSRSFREAAESNRRRHRLLVTGRRATATVVAARPTGELVGITPTLEIVLEVDAGTGHARTVTIVEPVPWMLASRLAPGSTVFVLMGTDSDEAMLDWSP